VLEGVFFEAVLLEAEGLVEAEGGLVGADYGELELFYLLAGVIDYGLDQLAAGAGAACGRADVHGAEEAFVGVLEAGELGETGGADQAGILVGAEDGGASQPAGIFFEGLVLFEFVDAAKGFGIEAETFETEFAECLGGGGG